MGHLNDFNQPIYDLFSVNIPDVNSPNLNKNGFSWIINNFMAKGQYDRAYDSTDLEFMSPINGKPVNPLKNLYFFIEAKRPQFKLADLPKETNLSEIEVAEISSKVKNIVIEKIPDAVSSTTKELIEYSSSNLKFNFITNLNIKSIKTEILKKNVFYPIYEIIIEISNLSTKSIVNHLYKLNLRNNFILANTTLSCMQNDIGDMMHYNLFYRAGARPMDLIMTNTLNLAAVRYNQIIMLKEFVNAALNISTTVVGGSEQELNVIMDKLQFKNSINLHIISKEFLFNLNNLTLIETRLKGLHIMNTLMYEHVHLKTFDLTFNYLYNVFETHIKNLTK